MLNIFNNIWTAIISVILIIVIIKKIYNINKPFDENKFIEQYTNQQKLKNKINIGINSIPLNLNKIASYYVGLN